MGGVGPRIVNGARILFKTITIMTCTCGGRRQWAWPVVRAEGAQAWSGRSGGFGSSRGRASHWAASGSQIVVQHLRESGYTFYRESMLVLGNSRRYVQAHTCARTHKHPHMHKHPCTHTRTHTDAHTPTSTTCKHAHKRAHAHKCAHTRPRTLW